MQKRRTYFAAGVAATFAFLALAAFAPTPAIATHLPADKIGVSGSTVEVTDPGEIVTLLSGVIRTSSPTDLIYRVTLECALFTGLTTVGNDEAQAIATIKAWVEFDGVPVGVNDGDDGKVVFCNRDYKRVTSLFDDEDATIEDHIDSRTANAFNWISLNAGSGVHTVELKGSVETETVGEAAASGTIGKRTLVVEPVKLANDVNV